MRLFASRLHRLFLLLPALLISSCKGPQVEGQVVDYFTRKPVAGVNVWITDEKLRTTTTDRQGRYSLSYLPGTVWVQFNKDGYVPGVIIVEAPAKKGYQNADAVMYRRPPGPGVFLVDPQSGEYKPLEQGTTCEESWSQHVGGTYSRTGYRYLIDVEPAKGNGAPPGKVSFVQYGIEQLAPSEIDLGRTSRTKGLDLVWVQNDGEVLKRQTSFGSVVRDVDALKSNPVEERTTLSDSMVISTYDLGHGTYALLSTRQRIPALGYPITIGTPNFHPTSICKGDH